MSRRLLENPEADIVERLRLLGYAPISCSTVRAAIESKVDLRCVEKQEFVGPRDAKPCTSLYETLQNNKVMVMAPFEEVNKPGMEI